MAQSLCALIGQQRINSLIMRKNNYLNLYIYLIYKLYNIERALHMPNSYRYDVAYSYDVV